MVLTREAATYVITHCNGPEITHSYTHTKKNTQKKEEKEEKNETIGGRKF